MEKLRVVLGVLNKYHFWILCGLIVLIAFGVWFVATADRAEATDKRRKLIEGEFQATNAIANTRDHPSQAYIDLIDKRVSGELTRNVANAAERLFNDQKSGFRLPPIYPNSQGDQARFEADFWKVWNHRIEQIEKPPADAKPGEFEIDRAYRLQYRDQIKNYFPGLFEMIELRTEVDPNGNAVAAPRHVGGNAVGAAGDDKSKQYKGVVDWADADTLMNYYQRWDDYPSTLAVIIAQEDLWVYEALLKVIHNTNNMAKDPKHEPYKSPPTQREASIKEILALEIGKDALQSWAAAENQVLAASEGGGAAPATGQPAVGQPTPGRAPGMTGMHAPGIFSGAATTAGVSPLAGRYVDNAGKPLDDPTQQPNQEFRMMPIDMRLIIEQKDIPKLLTECANSNMRIDVRAVRILAEKPGPFDPGGSSTGSETPAAAAGPAPVLGNIGPGRPGRHLPSMHNMGPQPGAATHPGGESGIYGYAEEAIDSTNPPVPVEIQGIIYIYNPLATQAPSSETAPGTPAAGVPAAGAPPAGGRAAVAPPAVGAGAPATTAAPSAPTAPVAPAPAPVPTPAPANGAGRSNPK